MEGLRRDKALCHKGITMEILIKERIRELRKERHETQVQVAEAIGIAEQHYQKLEYGTNIPNIENVWKLAGPF
ncbi:helix-turn-helix transcriptional regulator [Oscillospiraceae bacterium 38-13]